MSRLLDLIDAYKDAHGQPPDTSIARAIGVAPQTLNSWRTRGFKRPPRPETLRRLATLTGNDYVDVVLVAAMVDAGWMTDDEGGDGDVEAAPIAT